MQHSWPKIETYRLFIIQSNEYLNEFLKESRSIKNNSGLVDKLINNNNWNSNINVEQLNACILMRKQSNWICKEKASTIQTKKQLKLEFPSPQISITFLEIRFFGPIM